MYATSISLPAGHRRPSCSTPPPPAGPPRNSVIGHRGGTLVPWPSQELYRMAEPVCALQGVQQGGRGTPGAPVVQGHIVSTGTKFIFGEMIAPNLSMLRPDRHIRRLPRYICS